MSQTRILVVEDEGIIALSIQRKLENLGYDVPVTVSSGEEAIQQAAEIHPNLVLMDIRLDGQMTGIEAAAQLRTRFNIPVIYLTAYADKNTLQRAKVTDPFGYLLKPFEERELHTAIEMALYKHEAERKLKESEQRLAITLNSIGEAVVTTDFHGRITFMNPVAERLTGWKQSDALGKLFAKVVVLVNVKTKLKIENELTLVLGKRPFAEVALPNDTILIGQDGTQRALDGNAAPLTASSHDGHLRVVGVVLAFRDITERKWAERERAEQARLSAFSADISVTFTQSLSLREMLRRCTLAGVQHLDAAFARIWTLDSTGKMLLLQASSGLYTHIDGAHSRVPVDSGLKISMIAQTQEPHLTNTVLSDPWVGDKAWAKREGMVAFAGYPLMSAGQVIGVIGIFARKPLTDFALKALAVAADTIALGIKQKRAEEAQRASEERFRELLDDLQVGVLLYGPQEEILLSNQRALDLLGRSDAQLLAAPNNPFGHDIIQEDGTPFQSHPVTQAIATGQAQRNVVMGVYRPATASPVWLLVNAEPQFSNGKLYQVICSLNDITERKQERRYTKQLRVAAEVSEQISAILEPERLLSVTVSLLQERFDLYHVHVYLLDQAQCLLVMQIGSGEVGRQLRKDNHAISFDHEQSIVARVARSKQAVLINDTRTSATFLPNPLLPDTRSEVAVPLIVAGRLLGVLDVQDKQPNRFTQSDLDVFKTLAGGMGTALENARLYDTRRQAEQALRESATQLHTAADLAQQINAILDLNELLAKTVALLQSRFNLYHVHIYLLDESTQQLVMHTGSGEVGQRLRQRGHAIPFSRQKSLVARAARKQEIVLVNEVRDEPAFMPNPLLPDTRSEVAVPLIVGDRVLGVFDVQDDKPQRFTPSELDVLRTLAGQVATAIQNARLFEQVQQSLDETQRTAERLRELDRLKSEFLASMSHELRTPLNSIIGYSEIILMGLNGPLNEEMTEDIEAIRNSGQHLLHLINDILDLAKIEAGRMTLGYEDVEISGVLDQVRVSHLALLHDKPVELLIEMGQNVPPIEADRLRLNQILTNLVTNAIKFTEKGIVRLHTTYDDGWVQIAVQDEGIGMKESDLGTIFEQFRQVDGSNTRRAGGTGLGLAITNHLIQLHGGTISVESELDKGSTFFIRLPVKRPPEEDPNENSTQITQIIMIDAEVI
jgi:PAS domain S-box-containing protein